MILFGLNMVTQMNDTSFGILLPNIRDAFHLSNSGILSVVAVSAVVGLALQVPIAQAADRHNRVRLMLLGATIFAGFVFGTGLAIAAWMLVLMQSGAGIGKATVGPTHNPLIADWYPINSRPRVYSFYFGSNAVGAFLGPILAGGLAAWLGWRAPFIVLSVPVVILVLLGLRLREPSRGIQERMAMGVTDALLTEEPPPSFAEGWRTVWKIESLRRIFFALPFLAASLVGFASLASLLYQQKFGLDVVQRGWVAAAAEPAQLVGLAIGAHVSSKLIVKDPGLIIRFLAVVAAVAAGLLVLFALVPILWVTILVNMAVTASLAAIGAGIYGSLSLAIPARSRSLGFSMGALWVIPGLIILPIIGAIADTAGIRIGMLILVPVFLIGGLILSTAGRVIDRDITQVRTLAAARSEVLFARREGQVKLLLVRGLNVSYGQVQVLFDVDLEVDEGEIIALLGTNGAGKSTLLKAICGVVEADKGAVDIRRPGYHPRAAQRDRRLRYHPGARRPGGVPRALGGGEPAGGRLARPSPSPAERPSGSPRCWTCSPHWPAASTIPPPTSRGASSRCWRYRWPSWPDPGCCSSTSSASAWPRWSSSSCSPSSSSSARGAPR